MSKPFVLLLTLVSFSLYAEDRACMIESTYIIDGKKIKCATVCKSHLRPQKNHCEHSAKAYLLLLQVWVGSLDRLNTWPPARYRFKPYVRTTCNLETTLTTMRDRKTTSHCSQKHVSRVVARGDWAVSRLAVRSTGPPSASGEFRRWASTPRMRDN